MNPFGQASLAPNAIVSPHVGGVPLGAGARCSFPITEIWDYAFCPISKFAKSSRARTMPE